MARYRPTLTLHQSHEVSQEPNKFDLLCDTVSTAMVTLNGALEEVRPPPNRNTYYKLLPSLHFFFSLSAHVHTHSIQFFALKNELLKVSVLRYSTGIQRAFISTLCTSHTFCKCLYTILCTSHTFCILLCIRLTLSVNVCILSDGAGAYSDMIMGRITNTPVNRAAMAAQTLRIEHCLSSPLPQHTLPPKLLVHITLTVTRVFRWWVVASSMILKYKCPWVLAAVQMESHSFPCPRMEYGNETIKGTITDWGGEGGGG